MKDYSFTLLAKCCSTFCGLMHCRFLVSWVIFNFFVQVYLWLGLVGCWSSVSLLHSLGHWKLVHLWNCGPTLQSGFHTFYLVSFSAAFHIPIFIGFYQCVFRGRAGFGLVRFSVCYVFQPGNGCIVLTSFTVTKGKKNKKDKKGLLFNAD